MSNIPEPLLYWFQALTNNPKRVIGTKPRTIPQSKGSIIFSIHLYVYFTQIIFLVISSSSIAVEKVREIFSQRNFF